MNKYYAQIEYRIFVWQFANSDAPRVKNGLQVRGLATVSTSVT